MKKLFTIIISSLLLLSFAIVSCEKEDLGTATIYGLVTDKATGEPIKSAGVELLPVGWKTITGTDGRFEFANLKVGSYQVYITQAGYVEVISSNIELSQGQSLQRDVQMELLPPALRVVNDSRKDISELDFGSAETDVARSFNLFNDGAESLEWEITFTADWVKSVSKTEGVLKAGGTQALIITIDRTILTSGSNTTTLHITSNNGSKQLTLKAVNGTVFATLNTLPVTNLKTTSAVLNGEILTDGSPKYSERGFVYSLSSMPTVDNCIQKLTSTLTEDKKYSVTLTNLTQNQTYYVRAYAVNAGKYAYSTNEVFFMPSYSTATVTTQPVTNLVRSSGRATFTGTIVDMGDPAYTERGFVYATMHNPSVDTDSKLIVSGKGLGEFTGNVSGLVLGKTYYIRAYATNEQGTAYGNEVVADFNAILPEVETTSITVKSATSVYMVGTIESNGDPKYTERGFIYGKIQNPTIDDVSVTKVVASNTTSNQFEKQVSITLGSSMWYVRAYAKSSAGVVYGKILTMQDPEYSEYLKLPIFDFGGYNYHVYPDMGAMTWQQAISACNGLSYGGYSDWFLPSKYELNAMYQNKTAIGGFSSSTWYWSSTEHDSDDAHVQNFYNGSQNINYGNKSGSKGVRCVRRD